MLFLTIEYVRLRNIKHHQYAGQAVSNGQQLRIYL